MRSRDLRPEAEEYLAMWERLYAMCKAGKGESAAADQLRDQMDGPWRTLTNEELGTIKQYIKQSVEAARTGDAT